MRDHIQTKISRSGSVESARSVDEAPGKQSQSTYIRSYDKAWCDKKRVMVLQESQASHESPITNSKRCFGFRSQSLIGELLYRQMMMIKAVSFFFVFVSLFFLWYLFLCSVSDCLQYEARQNWKGLHAVYQCTVPSLIPFGFWWWFFFFWYIEVPLRKFASRYHILHPVSQKAYSIRFWDNFFSFVTSHL